MRISDWSSDVCSSDLKILQIDLHRRIRPIREFTLQRPVAERGVERHAVQLDVLRILDLQLGRVSAEHQAVRHRSEEHTSELQSLMRISYAVFCLKKKKTHRQ